MAKKLTVELLDGGTPVTGVVVSASGCGELITGPTGSVFFLVEEAQVQVSVAGQNVHSSTLDDLPAKLNFVINGGNWQPA